MYNCRCLAVLLLSSHDIRSAWGKPVGNTRTVNSAVRAFLSNLSDVAGWEKPSCHKAFSVMKLTFSIAYSLTLNSRVLARFFTRFKFITRLFSRTAGGTRRRRLTARIGQNGQQGAARGRPAQVGQHGNRRPRPHYLRAVQLVPVPAEPELRRAQLVPVEQELAPVHPGPRGIRPRRLRRLRATP